MQEREPNGEEHREKINELGQTRSKKQGVRSKSIDQESFPKCGEIKLQSSNCKSVERKRRRGESQKKTKYLYQNNKL